MQEEPQKKRSISYWLFPLEPVHSTVKVLPQKTQQRRHRGNRDPSCGNTNDWLRRHRSLQRRNEKKKKRVWTIGLPTRNACFYYIPGILYVRIPRVFVFLRMSTGKRKRIKCEEHDHYITYRTVCVDNTRYVPGGTFWANGWNLIWIEKQKTSQLCEIGSSNFNFSRKSCLQAAFIYCDSSLEHISCIQQQYRSSMILSMILLEHITGRIY